MDLFAALAEPNRRRMIELLSRGPRAAGDLAQAFPLSAPAVSQHLKALREAGLVRVEVDGQRRIYSLDLEGLAAVDAWLDRIRGFWGGRLDALETALREETE
ncbi:ArsR/SmtB family transcription factor [Sphingosinicella humi]|uniref:ArsR family transcriptional regulator n=1 Tax=Allosphingosinicella humi TaxID=2068657 RepID=A0A2U2IZE3_9SPHN|nr:metalloregulator ArsR/SmtB family transcription factor [Sphingosinicella humi]PWG01450.1 ArsR family transcriptional regulator [Sphingosinicella humi]